MNSCTPSISRYPKAAVPHGWTRGWPNISDLSSPSFLIGSRETTASLYQMSLAAVLYLEKRASLSAISTFLQKLADADDPRGAFQETFLFPYGELQSATLRSLGRDSH
jgi:hypothetical protein